MLTIYQEDMKYSTAKYLIEQDREIAGICKVVFKDATVELPIRPVIMMLPYWEVYINMGYPVTTEQIFFTDTPYNEKLYSKIMKKIYDDCFQEKESSEYFDTLKTCLWNTINNIDDFGSHQLLEYMSGLDIINMAEVHNDPKVQEIVNIDVSEKIGPMRIKQKTIQGQEELAKLLSTEGAIKNESLLPFMECNAFKVSQLFQMFGVCGLRTEINDRVFRKPVEGNFINGLTSFSDIVFDNSASRKNVYYSYDAIRLSQYFNREMALACMILRKLYKGDCGSNVLVPFKFNKEHMTHYHGKYFYVEGDPVEKVLTEKNSHLYEDADVYLNSILTCRHTDGMCEHCLGIISRNHTTGINVGTTASSNAVSEISQLVLSTKHEDQAMPTSYNIPVDIREYMEMTTQGIAFKPSKYKELADLEFGFSLNNLICSIGDLAYIDKDLDVPENKYSIIDRFSLRNTKTNEVTDFVAKDREIVPFLTTEFILYIRDHLQKGVTLSSDKMYWVPLKRIHKYKIPVMRTIIYNNSMMVFVSRLTNIFKQDKEGLRKFTNASKALQYVSDVIFEKVKGVNIFQLEILLRAHMVTDRDNYSIPVVTDIKDVKFEKTANVIAQRTISGQLAHESHNKHFCNPTTFTTLKDQNPLDLFIGI